MMTLRRLRYLSLALFLTATLGTTSAWSKAAEDYFHGAAYKFVAGRMQEASVDVEEGLRLYPNDPALKGLANHLRNLKDQKKKDQGSQGSSGGDQGKEDQQKKDDSQGGDKDQDKDKPEPKADPEKKDDKGKEGQDKAQNEPDSKDGKDSSGEAMAPVKPGEMSKEDAERLLNSIQDDEKKEHRQMQRRYRKKVEVEQDW